MFTNVYVGLVCSQLGAAYDECLGQLPRALDYQRVAVNILGAQGFAVAEDEAVALVRMCCGVLQCGVVCCNSCAAMFLIQQRSRRWICVLQ